MRISKKYLIQRWQELGSDIYKKRIFDAFVIGKPIQEYLSPFNLHDNRIDLRGLRITPEVPLERTKINNCIFKNVDLSFSIVGDALVENCYFENVVFDKTDMRQFGDFGNRFLHCQFNKTDFAAAFIGYKGSKYIECEFSNAKFNRTSFIRPEFDKCLFDNCKLYNANFSASSFNSCKFSGLLNAVTFSNGYFWGESMNEKYGIPTPNCMKNVSFEGAEFKKVGFVRGVDLSTVILPKNGEYRLYDQFNKRMEILKEHAYEFEGKHKVDVDVFIKVGLAE